MIKIKLIISIIFIIITLFININFKIEIKNEINQTSINEEYKDYNQIINNSKEKYNNTDIVGLSKIKNIEDVIVVQKKTTIII